MEAFVDPDDGRDALDADKARRGSPYLNTKEAARYLGLSSVTLRKRRCAGKDPQFVRVGRTVRYHIRDLVAFLKDANGEENQRV
jgi:hypothetical protein